MRISLKQLTLGVLGISLILALSAFCLSRLSNWIDSEIVLQKIDCGKDRKIVITADRFWETSRPISYTVLVGKVVVIPRTYFDDDRGEIEHRYTLVRSTNEDLVAVTTANSDSFLIIHDFTDGASWPCGEHIDWDSRFSVEQNRLHRSESRRQLEERLRQSLRID